MDIPKIEFKVLKGKAEQDLLEFMDESEAKGYWQFLVYLRQKYDFEEKWCYSIEYCFHDISNDCLTWEFDWNEGQKVEYLAVFCFN